MSGFLLITYSKITDAYTLYLINIFRYVMQHAELYRYLLKQTRFNLNLLFSAQDSPDSTKSARLSALSRIKSEQSK